MVVNISFLNVIPRQILKHVKITVLSMLLFDLFMLVGYVTKSVFSVLPIIIKIN